MSASCDTVSFDFFAVHEIRSILRTNHISVASSFYYTCLKLSRLRIHRSEWYGTPGFFFLCESNCGYLLVLISFSENSFFALFSLQFQCSCIHHLIVKYPRAVFELIPLLEFIPPNKDVDLWTLIISTDYHYFCLCYSTPIFFYCFFLQRCLIIVASLLYFLQLIQWHKHISNCLYCAPLLEFLYILLGFA